MLLLSTHLPAFAMSWFKRTIRGRSVKPSGNACLLIISDNCLTTVSGHHPSEEALREPLVVRTDVPAEQHGGGIEQRIFRISIIPGFEHLELIRDRPVPGLQREERATISQGILFQDGGGDESGDRESGILMIPYGIWECPRNLGQTIEA